MTRAPLALVAIGASSTLAAALHAPSLLAFVVIVALLSACGLAVLAEEMGL